MEKILSIIIPTYNMEKYLQKCLDSLIVCEENMKLLEVLVVNDGSKDSSSQIAHEYEKNYPDTFRVIDKENGNYGSCINRGLKEATGKYVKILDADDSFDNSVFNDYLNTLKTVDVDLIVNDTIIIDDKNNEIGKWTYEKMKQTFNFYEENIFPTHHRVAYKTQILKDLSYKQTEGIMYTDQQWVFTPLSNIKKSIYINRALYRYLMGRIGQSMSTDVAKKNLSHRIRVMNDMLSVFDKVPKRNNEGYQWMRKKIIRQISSVYHLMLIEYRDDSNSQIIEFDNNLKEYNPQLHQDVLDSMLLSEKLKYNYGEYWHKHHRINKLHPLVICYYLYKYLFKRNDENSF